MKRDSIRQVPVFTIPVIAQVTIVILAPAAMINSFGKVGQTNQAFKVVYKSSAIYTDFCMPSKQHDGDNQPSEQGTVHPRQQRSIRATKTAVSDYVWFINHNLLEKKRLIIA